MKHHRSLRTLLLVVFILFFAAYLPPANAQTGEIIRVAVDGATSGTCGDLPDWSNPCDLQYAMDKASPGSEVWVQEGVYKPHSQYPSQYRGNAFFPRSGVEVYGGFTGTETAREQRRWDQYQTVLSGDIDNNDLAGLPGDWRNIQGENSAHVVAFDDSDSTIPPVLDGFQITGGQATRSGIGGHFGGGVYLDNGSAYLRNLWINGSMADHGGGLYAYGQTDMVLLDNITISGCYAEGDGGAIYAFNSKINFSNVTISGNVSMGYRGMGGGIFSVDSDLTLQYVTLANNSAFRGGGLVSYGNGNNIRMGRSIIWNNTAEEGAQIWETSSSAIIAYDSVIQDGEEWRAITDPPLLGPLGDYGGGLPTHPLLPGSSAIGLYPEACPETDARGVARPQGAGCDAGAFESRGFTLTATGGSGQSTYVGIPFAEPLTVSVTSADGEPVDGGYVIFTAPESGPSAMISGSPAVITNGQASVTAQANDIAGEYTVTAYAEGADPLTYTLTNLKIPTQTAITARVPENPVVGQPVTIQFSVSASPTLSGTPGGDVTITASRESADPLTCTAPVSAGECSLTLPHAGTYTLTAQYGGDDQFEGSAAPESSLSVDPAKTRITLSVVNYPVITHQVFTILARVEIEAPGAGIPDGVVEITIPGQPLLRVDLSDGQAFSTGVIPSAGTYPVTAQYQGNSDYLASSGQLEGGLRVLPPAPVLTALNPSLVMETSPGFTLTVSGSGFLSDAVVRWDAVDLVTNHVSATVLTAQVPAYLIQQAGQASIRVVNPDEIVSGSLTLTVRPRFKCYLPVVAALHSQ